jgi:hypothetical protein
MGVEMKKKPVIFKGEDMEFAYDYNSLTVLQVESALEVLRFKTDQDASKPDSFHQVQRSGGHAWRSMAFSFLLSEYKDGKMIPFTEGDEVRNLAFIRKLTGEKNFREMEDCLEDFFTKRGMQKSLSAATQSVQELNLKAQFVQSLVERMVAQSANASLPTGS